MMRCDTHQIIITGVDHRIVVTAIVYSIVATATEDGENTQETARGQRLEHNHDDMGHIHFASVSFGIRLLSDHGISW